MSKETYQVPLHPTTKTPKRIYSGLIKAKVKPRNLLFVRKKKPAKIYFEVSDRIGDADFLSHFYENHHYDSFHYYIGLDGDLYGGYPETYISEAPGADWINEEAITILLSLSYEDIKKPVSDKSLETLVKLLTDLCRRYGIKPNYNGEVTGSFVTKDMWSASYRESPFLKAKMLELSYQVKNVLNGLPAQLNKTQGFFRVRKSAKSKRTQIGIFTDFNEAVLKAFQTGRNVYDKDGNEVFNCELSSPVTVWDNNAPPAIGDTVTSEAFFLEKVPGSTKAYAKRDGRYYVYVTGLGGMVPFETMDETEESIRRNKDGRLYARKTIVQLHEGRVEDVNEDLTKVKVHGWWFPLSAILVKRNTTNKDLELDTYEPLVE